MFRKEARLFQRLVIKTRWIGNDDKFIYVEQVIFTDDKKRQFVSRAVLRIMAFDPKQRKLVTACDFVHKLHDLKDREEAEKKHEEYVELGKHDTRVQSFIESHEFMKEGAIEVVNGAEK